MKYFEIVLNARLLKRAKKAIKNVFLEKIVKMLFLPGAIKQCSANMKCL